MRTVLTSLHSKYIHNSLALPCLAAYCGTSCGEILMREFTVHEPRETIVGMLLSEQPDVVAFSVYLWNRFETLALVDALTVAHPELKIVLGGPEVSFDGVELFDRHPGVTALICGEGESPLKALLAAWQDGRDPGAIPRLFRRERGEVIQGEPGPVLVDLDDIPSPFRLGLVDFGRGFVYYETSRGCPYRCSFCMSALDDRVRSFSMSRIRQDLGLLMANEVPKIKLVDRTFNYHAERTRDIFRFILDHNRSSHFHFEIGAHLLDAETLDLLDAVPPGMFQFEIGVQSTHEATLSAVDRNVAMPRLEANVRRLRQAGRIHLHLDLVAGLPGEGYHDFLASIDRVAALRPHHLQIEPVKVLPGSPLRDQAQQLGLRFDPNPPYTVLANRELTFVDLEKLRGISRLLDLTWNSGHFNGVLDRLAEVCDSLATGLERLQAYWYKHDLFRYPMSRHDLFLSLEKFISQEWDGEAGRTLREALAYDYAVCERVQPQRPPAFFDVELTAAERVWVKQQVEQVASALRGRNTKLQHFAAAFSGLPGLAGRTMLLFLYKTRTGKGRTTEVLRPGEKDGPGEQYFFPGL